MGDKFNWKSDVGLDSTGFGVHGDKLSLQDAKVCEGCQKPILIRGSRAFSQEVVLQNFSIMQPLLYQANSVSSVRYYQSFGNWHMGMYRSSSA
jgi:hypothetical protein